MISVPPAIREHWFWAALTLAVLVWYSTITVWVSIKGVFDIKGMLRRLASRELAEKSGARSPNPEGNPKG